MSDSHPRPDPIHPSDYHGENGAESIDINTGVMSP